MVSRVEGYYGTDFKGEIGVTQGDLLYPTIFNVVVDAVVFLGVTGLIAVAEERGEVGKVGRQQADFFTQTMAWLPRLNPDGCRVRSTPWSDCLAGWACGQM